jgi:signal transduction histidine kinase
MLSQITRHDILNKLNNLFSISDALSDEVSNEPSDTPSVKSLLELLDHDLTTVMRQIEFSRYYQELGVHGAEWQDANTCIEKGRLLLIHPPVELLADNLPMIWADPLLEKAVYNLIENSLRHGEHVTQIKVTFSAEDDDNGILIFEDNGIGVPDEHKERIFDLSFGKNTGLGLFLSREILELTNMKIRECGQFGHGARFDIMIPPGYWKWQLEAAYRQIDKK